MNMRLLKKTQLLCAVLLLWTVGAYAQNVVKGKVVSRRPTSRWSA